MEVFVKGYEENLGRNGASLLWVEFYFFPSSTASGPPSPSGGRQEKRETSAPLLEQRKVNVVLGHRKRQTYAFAHLVPKKHYQCFS